MRKLIQRFTQKSAKSAELAKNRLHFIIVQQRTTNNVQDLIPILQDEIMAVVKKYVQSDEISINLQSKDNNSVLELNVILPEETSALHHTKATPEETTQA